MKHHNFQPTPFLPFDSDYINEYNDLILEFQQKALKLGIKYCEKRVTVNNDTINTYKTKYTNTDNLNEKLNDIKIKKERKFKSKFDSENERVLRYRGQLIRVLTKDSRNDSKVEMNGCKMIFFGESRLICRPPPHISGHEVYGQSLLNRFLKQSKNFKTSIIAQKYY
jgi:hypothetical protein